MKVGKKSVRQRVEIFVPDGGNVNQVDSAIKVVLVALSAIDRYMMAACSQARRQFFGEGFKAAVSRRNTACAQDGEAHV